MRVLPMGPAAVLVEDPPGGPAAWCAGLRERVGDDAIEVVPAARTVLVACTDRERLDVVIDAFDDVRPDHGDRAAALIEVPVHYDGDDLDTVAALIGVPPAEVVALHSGALYRVAFCGFAPGFGYLLGLPEALHLPRRSTPRQRVPAGSVAIAAEYSAVYPGPSPGGWHLLGRTELTLFDPAAEPPALLQPGDRVRFVAST